MGLCHLELGMRLCVVKKGSGFPNCPVTPIAGVLTSRELLLVGRYLGHEKLLGPDRTDLSRALATLEQKEAWLELGGGADKEGELYTVVHRAETYHLRKFARSVEREADTLESLHSPLSGVVLNLHHCFGEANEQLGDAGPGSESASRNDSWGTRKLGSFLFQILEESGLASWSPPFLKNRAANRLALTTAMGRFFLAEGIPASEFFYPDYSSLTVRRAVKVLNEHKARWPRGARPYALFTALAKTVSSESMDVIGSKGINRVPFAGVLRRPGASGTQGPFLVIFTFAQDAATGEFCPIKGFAVPVLSEDCWLPVESNHERRVLVPLKSTVETASARGWPLTLRKPMLEIYHAGEKRAVRPDFELKWHEHTLAIEVLGSDDADYLESKKSMAVVLKRHAAYVEVDAYKARGRRDDLDQENRLMAAVGTWISERL